MDSLLKLLPAGDLADFLFEVLQDGDPVAIRGSKATQIVDFLAALDTEGNAAGVAALSHEQRRHRPHRGGGGAPAPMRIPGPAKRSSRLLFPGKRTR